MDTLDFLDMLIRTLGALHAAVAVFYVRNSRGAIAWAGGLLFLPYLTLPLFWAFGPRRFFNYRKKILQAGAIYEQGRGNALSGGMHHGDHHFSLPPPFEDDQLFFQRLSGGEFCTGNRIDLFRSGEEYFSTLLAEIEKAREYIFLQFYIVRADEAGNELAELLAKKSGEGVRIYFLFDQIGSAWLSRKYIKRLRAAGVHIESFRTNRWFRNPFLLNFRNHRKIVVCDSKVAFIGGSNIGREYFQLTRRFKRWRDTDIQIRGPVIADIQRSFEKDWFWATEQRLPGIHTSCEPAEENLSVIAIPTGPVSELDEGSLLFHHLITLSQKRVWIASPYLVPDSGIIQALQLAVLRGVDVRILLPTIWDHPLVSLATAFYAREMVTSGARVYRYQPGFMHQKALLIDEDFSLVGTPNLDNRSLHINFEIALLVHGRDFAKKCEEMLEDDFKNSVELTEERFLRESQAFVLATRFARLFSPLL
jgi:cardiolipin synthase